MTWLEHHRTSEHYAQLAEDAVRQQDLPLAQTGATSIRYN